MMLPILRKVENLEKHALKCSFLNEYVGLNNSIVLQSSRENKIKLIGKIRRKIKKTIFFMKKALNYHFFCYQTFSEQKEQSLFFLPN